MKPPAFTMPNAPRPSLPHPRISKGGIVTLASIVAATALSISHWKSATDLIRDAVTHFHFTPNIATPHPGKTKALFAYNPDNIPAKDTYALIITGETIKQKLYPTPEGAFEISVEYYGKDIWFFCANSTTKLGEARITPEDGQIVIIQPAKPIQNRVPQPPPTR